MNSQLDADFEVDAFRHRAGGTTEPKDPDASGGDPRHLRLSAPSTSCGSRCARGKHHLLTEYSTKFTRDQVHQEFAAVGLAVLGSWTDERGDFLVTLARRAG